MCVGDMRKPRSRSLDGHNGLAGAVALLDDKVDTREEVRLELLGLVGVERGFEFLTIFRKPPIKQHRVWCALHAAYPVELNDLTLVML